MFFFCYVFFQTLWRTLYFTAWSQRFSVRVLLTPGTPSSNCAKSGEIRNYSSPTVALISHVSFPFVLSQIVLLSSVSFSNDGLLCIIQLSHNFLCFFSRSPFHGSFQGDLFWSVLAASLLLRCLAPPSLPVFPARVSSFLFFFPSFLSFFPDPSVRSSSPSFSRGTSCGTSCGTSRGTSRVH